MNTQSYFLKGKDKYFLFLLCFLILQIPTQGQIQVGPCATSSTAFPDLQSAYNSLAGGGTITTNVVIDVCPGTYTNQPLVLPPLPLASGVKVYIQGTGANPSDTRFCVSNPGPPAALFLQGARQLEFRNMTFELAPHPSRTSWNVLTSNGNAGKITFDQVHFIAPILSTSGAAYGSKPVCRVQQINDRVHFDHCHIEGGSDAIFMEVNSPGTFPELRITNSQLVENRATGVFISSSLTNGKVEALHNTIQSSLPGIYHGILHNAFDVELFASDNSILASQKTRVTGIQSQSHMQTMLENEIYLTECQIPIGILLVQQYGDVVCEGNDIIHTLPEEKEVEEFVGIKLFPDFIDHEHTTHSVKVNQNSIWSENGVLGTGILGSLNGDLISGELEINYNVISFPEVSSNDLPKMKGIFLQGGNAILNDLVVKGNKVTMVNAVSYRIAGEYIQCRGIELEDLSYKGKCNVFSNTVELGRNSENDARGISLYQIRKGVGTSIPDIWIGNNMVGFDFYERKSYGIILEDLDACKVVHNSIYLRNSSVSTGLSRALRVRESSAGSFSDLQLFNNAFGVEGGAYLIDVNCSACLSAGNVNDYYSYGGTDEFLWGGSAVTGVANWYSASGIDANALNTNPRFMSYFDLHLKNTSDLIDTAMNMAIPSEAIDLIYDIDLDYRDPALGTPDVGADENATATKYAVTEEMTPTFLAYPNPTQGMVTLEGLEAGTLEFVDVLGKVQFKTQCPKGKFSLDLQDLPAGIYLVRNQSASQRIQIRKLIRR